MSRPPAPSHIHITHETPGAGPLGRPKPSVKTSFNIAKPLQSRDGDGAVKGAGSEVQALPWRVESGVLVRVAS